MKIEYTYTLFVVKDSHGNYDTAITENFSESIQIDGLKTPYEMPLRYDDDSKHLEGWCEENRLGYYSEEVTETRVVPFVGSELLGKCETCGCKVPIGGTCPNK